MRPRLRGLGHGRGGRHGRGRAGRLLDGLLECHVLPLPASVVSLALIALTLSARPWVRLRMYLFESFGSHMGIPLRRLQGGMPQDFLHHA